MSRTLAIVGAGAKAVAVAAKAAVLRQMGVETLDVVAVERTGVAANWRAEGGWTDGRQRLSTSPEKDVGFPYRSTLVPGRDAEVDERMMRFSWQSYLVATGQFVGWVDRGRPAPTHETWARYLRWAAGVAGLNVVRGELARVEADGPCWRLYTDDHRLAADTLMVTGPGQPERCVLPGDPRVLSVAQFWRRTAARDRIVAGDVAVIGGGETAASVLSELFHHRVSTITAVSPQATLFTRGEGFFENSLFSDPTDWINLTPAERRDCISRTDRGVFSARVQESLLADERIRHLRGRVTDVAGRDDGVWITVRADRPGPADPGPAGGAGRCETAHGFDLIVDGSGVDPLWFLPLLDRSALDSLQSCCGGPLTAERLEESIGADLSVAGSCPKLILPNLAGLNVGPGFPNLSCLGLLSDRVLAGRTGAADPSMERSSDYQSV